MKIFVTILLTALITIFISSSNNNFDETPIEAIRNKPIPIIIVTTTEKIKQLDILIQHTNETIVNDVRMSKNKKDIECLAKNAFHEARNQPAIGKVAVTFVVMNRAKKNDVGVCKTVYKKHQFSWVRHVKTRRHNVIEDKAWVEALSVAYLVLNNKVEDPTGGAGFYFNPKTAHPRWAKAMTAVNTAFTSTGYLGDHLFLKN